MRTTLPRARFGFALLSFEKGERTRVEAVIFSPANHLEEQQDSRRCNADGGGYHG